MFLSIVIPAYNEKESLPTLLEEITEVCGSLGEYEVLVIDDGSQDDSFQWLKSVREQYTNLIPIRFSCNVGKAFALSEGFKRAKGRFIVTMDADLQDDPKEIPNLFKKLEEGFDLVSGWKKKRFDPLGKTLPSKFFNFVVRIASGTHLNDFNCGFKLYRRKVTSQLNLYGDLHRYIPVMASWNGFKIGECVVEHRSRRFGESKYGWSRLFHGFFDLITMLFLHRYNTRPLHVFGMVGFLLMALGGGLVTYFLILWLMYGQLTLRPLMVGGFVCILLGVQIVSLGLVGEMIVYRDHQKKFKVED